MNEKERRALRELRFDSAQTPAGVWKTASYHVSELHREAMQRIADGLEDAERCADDSPLGVVVQGAAGAGKTHLLGTAREYTQRNGGYFSLIELNDAVPFWTGVAEALRADLLRPGVEKRSQLHDFLDRLAVRITVPADVREIVLGERGGLTQRVIGVFVDALRRFDGTLGLEVQDTLRALILLGSNDFAAQDIGQSHLQSVLSADVDDRAFWGLRQAPKTPPQVVHDISCLLALTGPTVVAIDQLDGLFARTTTSTLHSDAADDPAFQKILGEIADGLLTLRQITRRTLTVITCLPDIWVLIKKHAAGPVPDRFRETYTLDRIPTGEVARAIVAKRFAEHFTEIRFEPPYPTWPIASEAFDRPVPYTPRKLIKRVEAHITQCLRHDRVVPLRNFDVDELTPFADGTASGRSSAAVASGTAGIGEAGTARVAAEPGNDALRSNPAVLAEFDARFARLRDQAATASALDPATEDKVLSRWLTAGLRSWIIESGVSEEEYKAFATTAPRPGVHATLRRVLDPDYELDRRWSFRGIAATNANAVLSRIKTANTLAAPASGQYARRLIMLRNTPWPNGRKTSEVIEAFLDKGGEVRTLSEPDLRTFAALEALFTEDDERLPLWLADRRPAMGTTLLREVLADEAPAQAPDDATTAPSEAATNTDADTDTPTPTPTPTLMPAPSPEVAPSQEPTQPPLWLAETPPTAQPEQAIVPPPPPTLDAETEISLGAVIADGASFRVGLEALRKHTIIFAGSGSGKTVLIRRLIEECAIKGVSSIVLDPNNDLARLNESWPQPPSAWGPQDPAKAAEYFAAADVVIWTPGVTSGRPLVLPSLPDISAAAEGSDERRELVDEAVSILAPRAKLTGASSKAAISEAVLRQALLYHARHNPQECTSLPAFIAQLSRLPDTALSITGGQKIAGDLAALLEAARTNDSLFGGSGTPLDPGVLLTPAPGRRARVSVISFIGLSSEEQRQAFVNQLQIALFGWIKAHPARDRPLSGLYIMDEAQTFAPTSGKTACTDSTNRLVSQARKYGLGLVFATQAPRNLQTKIANNCATQFLGVLSGSANLEAAWDLARSKGSNVEDIGVLETGQFYAARPGEGFAKIKAPLCLSYHASALTREEIVSRAAPGPGRRRKHAAEARLPRGYGEQSHEAPEEGTSSAPD
jgi:hypothetical protein